MRALLLVLLLVACATPVEDCQILRPVSEDEARRLHGNFLILSATAECASGLCMQDTPDASVGTCAQPCLPGCPEGMQCVQVDEQRLCLP